MLYGSFFLSIEIQACLMLLLLQSDVQLIQNYIVKLVIGIIFTFIASDEEATIKEKLHVLQQDKSLSMGKR